MARMETVWRKNEEAKPKKKKKKSRYEKEMFEKKSRVSCQDLCVLY